MKAPKPKKPSYSKALKELWRWFALYIKEKAGWKCEIHKRAKELKIVLPFKCSDQMQACHKIPKGNNSKAIYYSIPNLFCGCASSNLWEKNNRLEFNQICKQLWKDDMEFLEGIQKMPFQRKLSDVLAMTIYYKQQYEGLKK
jgi:hypothetical protein